MKFKFLFRILLLVALLLLLNDVFARAGGGGGGGGGGGASSGGGYGFHGYTGSHNGYHNVNGNYAFMMVILLVALLLIASIIPLLLKLKSHVAAKIITRASNKDSFWDAAQLEKHAKSTFHKMQYAWMKRNMAEVKSKVTEDLYANYMTLLSEMKKRREKNMLSHIKIHTIQIIGCEDFKDDSKDRYVAYIKGSMLDYTINERSNEIIQNPDRVIATFSDTYHFVRSSNIWLLEKINNTVRVQDIIETENSIET